MATNFSCSVRVVEKSYGRTFTVRASKWATAFQRAALHAAREPELKGKHFNQMTIFVERLKWPR